MSEPYPDYSRIGDDLKRLGEYVALMASDARMPHDIEAVGDNQFQLGRHGRTVRLPTYKELVSAIERVRNR